ncbi:MAG: serine hydrolase [Clostridia bacterium]|nr:serine hydrolase [Clostridia bacterium]
MSYKLAINASSIIGDNINSFNEAIFADGISSFNSGVCSPLEMKTLSRGKKHVVSVMSSDETFDAQCMSLKDILNKHNTSSLSIKVQYNLKSSLEQLYERTDADSNLSDMTMFYTDGQSAYIAGYGEVNAYHYSAKTKSVQKVEFVGIKESESVDAADADLATEVKIRIPARVKRISNLCSGDEYLLVGKNLKVFFNDEQIIDIFTEHGENAIAFMLAEAQKRGCRDNLSVAHVTVKKQHAAAIITTLAIIALVLAGFLVYSTFLSDDTENVSTTLSDNVIQSDEKQITSTLDEENDNDKESESESSSSSDLQNESVSDSELDSLEGLVPELDAIGSEITGEYNIVSYYVKNLTTGEVIKSNDSKMYSASLIKLYIMAEIYRQVDVGELTMDDELKNLLTQMITVSDNDACNTLATIAGGGNQQLGFERITDNARNLGCGHTVQKNDLQAVREVPISTGNFTSVGDCALILEKIYNGELVSPEASADMLALLKGQQRRNKIPRDLPEGVVVANKTGETSTAQNDVAIVYSEKTPYIICIMINDYANSMDDAMDVVARMSKATYDYIMK